MTHRVMTWGEALTDPSLDNWTRQAFDAVEILVHADDPSPNARAEFFTAPNRGMTIGEVIDRAAALGLKVILNLDIYYGNGRDEDGGSATGAGKYHYSWTEGGYGSAIDAVLKWPARYLAPVIALQILNEPKNAEWIAAWCANALEKRAGKIRGAGWKIVIDSGSEHLDAYAHLADVIDPHLLFDTVGQVGSRVRELVAAYPEHEVWVTELTAEQARDTLEVTQAALAAGAKSVSAFSGNRLDFGPGEIPWNGKPLPPFVCQTRGGESVTGAEWNELWEITDPGYGDVTIPPTQPPPDGPGYNRDDAADDVSFALRKVEKHGYKMGEERGQKVEDALRRASGWL